MTKREAIDAVKEITGMSLPWDDRHYEALQMAIKALEEQSTLSERLENAYDHGWTDAESEWRKRMDEKQNDSDLISRRDAINIPVLPKEYRTYQTHNLDDAYEAGWNGALFCIGDLPPAQTDLSGYSDRLYKAGYENGKRDAWGAVKYLWKCGALSIDWTAEEIRKRLKEDEYQVGDIITDGDAERT